MYTVTESGNCVIVLVKPVSMAVGDWVVTPTYEQPGRGMVHMGLSIMIAGKLIGGRLIFTGYP
jgi:hypothetical protein